MNDLSGGITEDALFGGRVRLLQPATGHRAGTDAVLLAAAAAVRAGETVVDVGAATGAVGLMAAARAPIRTLFLERDTALAELCRRNIALNGADGEVVTVDVLDPAALREAGLDREAADCVVTNPPFLEEGSARLSPDAGRASAHALPPDGLARWLKACASLLKPKGRLVLVHRADRLGDCLNLLPSGFGGLQLRLVHPKPDQPATRLLLSGVKGSRAPMVVAPPLILHEPSGRFTALADALHRGEGALP